MSRFHCPCDHCGRVYGFDRDPAGKWFRCGGCRKNTRVPGSRGFLGGLSDFLSQLDPNATDRCAWCGTSIPRYAPVCRACGRDQPPPGTLYDAPPGK